MLYNTIILLWFTIFIDMPLQGFWGSILEWSFKVINSFCYCFVFRLTFGHWELLLLNLPRESLQILTCIQWEFCFLFQKTTPQLLLETLLSLSRSLLMLAWIRIHRLWVYGITAVGFLLFHLLLTETVFPMAENKVCVKTSVIHLYC